MTKREAGRRANGAKMWRQRRELAKRSAVDAASVAFDLARKQVKAIRRDEHDPWWRRLAALLDEFTATIHDAASCSQQAGSCEVHSPSAGFGSGMDPGARPRARKSTGDHEESSTLEGET